MKTTATKKVENKIRENILNGIWKPNTLLPSNNDLMKIFSVGRNTLINAMIPLVEEGLIVRKPKVGTVVLDKDDYDKNIVILGQVQNNLPTSYYLTQILQHLIELFNSENIRYKISLGHGDSVKEFIDSLYLFDKSNLENTCGIININPKIPIENLVNNKIPCVSYAPNVGFHFNEVVFDNAIINSHAFNILKSHNFKSIGVINLISEVNPNEFSNYPTVQTQIENKNLKISEMKEVYKDIKTLDVYDYTLHAGKAHIEIEKFLLNNKDLEVVLIDDDNFLWDMNIALKNLKYTVPKDIKILTKSNKDRSYGFAMNWNRLETDLSEIANMLYKTLKHAMNNKTTTPQGIKKFVVPTYISGNSL